MKILVCTDGSEHSQKAVKEASKIVKCYADPEVTVAYIYERKPALDYSGRGDLYISDAVLEQLKEDAEKRKEEKKELLIEAAKVFEENGIKANIELKEGHPAQTIVKMVEEEGFELVVLGSRGVSGLKRLFLGSVSNAVLQEARCNVLIVK